MSIKNNKSNLDSKLFWPSIIFTFLILASAVVAPEKSLKVANAGKNWVTYDMGWLVQIGGLGALIFLLWLSFGKYGNVKLGDKSDKPEFSNSTYAFLMFTAGVGASLIYWAIGEPMYYLQAPPMFAKVGSVESTQWLITYSMYHWGPIGWSIFCLPAVPFAYYLHKRKNRNLRLSAVCSDVIGEKNANSWIGYAINIIAIFATLGAFSTSMGFTVDLLGSGINRMFGIPNNIYLQVGIVLLFVVFYSVVMLAGMKKGVAKLSNICVYTALALGGFILIVGPTRFIVSYFFDSLGVLGTNFFRMSLWSDPVQKSGFPQDWTMYYWAWYFAYLVMMGLFLARISKGRTIKQLVLTCITSGSAGCAFFIAIFGGYAVNGQLTGKLPLIEWMNSLGSSPAIIETIASLPLGNIVLVIFLIVEFFLMSTTMTSATVAVSMMTTKELDADAEPDLKVRMAWTVGIAAVSLAAFFMGGSINTIKSMCVLVGFPMIILYIIMTVCLMKWLKQDYAHLDKTEI
ncbi:MAG: BCCT family transporter [Tepidibacter sp.]|jgi:choline/carnitine/betaine transport|uniref:BCCT family transporter n=1 Tax=Tepidibacter sp. TaxID=2529387 RepID=UPI0025DAA60A|nr:BCCT family transporter [Tepidibacter sp.]MCT4507212.1 BCCT family transporter [Tepidibacter sp.]